MAAAKSSVIADRSDLADLNRVLDEELAKLPEQYRTPIVHCDLNGKSRSVAAEELDIPEGTLGTRLAKAREMLAVRLRQRGVTLSVAGLTGYLTTQATAAVPVELGELTLTVSESTKCASPVVLAMAQMSYNSIHHPVTHLVFVVCSAVVVLTGLVGAAVMLPVPAAPVLPVPLNVPFNAPPEDKAEANAEGWKELKPLEQTAWLPGSVAYSPDGKMIVVGGSGGHVSAYDSVSGKQLWEYHDGEHFAAIAFSRAQLEKNDGAELAITFKDGARFLDPQTGKLTETLTEEGSDPLRVAYFRDGPSGRKANDPVRKVVFGNARGYTMKSWLEWPKFGTIHASTVPMVGNKPFDKYAIPLAVDPRSRAETHAIMTGPIDRAKNRNVLWAYSCGGPGGNHLLEGHNAIVTSAAWSSDGTTAITGDRAGEVILWDTATWKAKANFKLTHRVEALAINADGTQVAAAVAATLPERTDYFERVFIWNPTKDLPKPLPIAGVKAVGGPFLGTAGLSFSPDGKSLAAGFCNFDHLSKSGELIGKVRIWSLDDPKKPDPVKPVQQKWNERSVLKDHDDLVYAVAMSPNGLRMATAGFDGTVTIRNTTTLKPIFTVKGGIQPGVAFSPDNTMLAVTQNGGATFHSAIDGKLLGSMIDPQAPPHSLAFNSNGKELASNDGRSPTKTAVLAVLGDKPPPEKVAEPPKVRSAIAWTPRDREVLFLHNWKDVSEVRIWPNGNNDGPTKLTSHTGTVNCMTVSPDGKFIATGGSDSQVILYDLVTFKELRRVKLGGRNGKSAIHALAFSPDSKTVAASVEFEDGKGVIRIIFVDVETGSEVGFKIHGTVPASSMAYSKDGKTLFAAYGWENPGAKPLTAAERKTAGGLLVLDLDAK